MNTLRFPASTFERLRDVLLASAPNEGAAIVLAEHFAVEGSAYFLVREVHHVPPEFVEAAPLSVEIAPEFIARVMKRARTEQLSLFFAHSHPNSSHAAFSAVDDAGEARLMPTVFQRIADGPHGAIVVTPTDCSARMYVTAKAPPTPMRVVQVSSQVRTWPAIAGDAELDPHSDRTVRALGEAAQAILGDLRVGIVGLGGMGSLVAQQLAHLGVRHFVLIDPECVEATNLNRLVGATREVVGERKVAVAARLIASVQPNASIDARAGDIRFEADARSLLGLDVVFGCTDSHGSRAILNQLAHQYFLPVIDTGVRIDATNGKITAVVGRVQLLTPDLPCLICESLLDAEQVRRDLLTDNERARDPYIVGAHEPQPAVISINGTVASLAVTMLLAATCGFPLASRHQIYMADKGVVRNVVADKSSECFVCSTMGAYAKGDRWRVPWRRR